MKTRYRCLHLDTFLSQTSLRNPDFWFENCQCFQHVTNDRLRQKEKFQKSTWYFNECHNSMPILLSDEV